MTSITTGGKTYTYAYDADGIRTQKVVDGVTHTYVTQNGKLVRESFPYGDTTIIMDFIYDESGKPFAVCYSKNGGSSYTTYFYGVNAQGDVEKIFRMTKNADTGEYEETVYGRYVYDAWGNVTATTAAGAAAGTTTLVYRNPIRYRGYCYDNETGFYYLQSRYYDPANHRFINADGYASTGQGFVGTNMFAYCGNNPVIYIDPAGHWFQYVIDAIFVITAAAVVFAIPTLDPAAVTSTATVVVAVVAADMPSQEEHYNRNEILENTPENVPSDPYEAVQWDWRTEAALYHQNNTKGGPNVKYISPDGVKEVIYYADGSINNTPEDMGTANYCSPSKYPIGHLINDMIPYWLWKNSPEDSTTWQQRVFAN